MSESKLPPDILKRYLPNELSSRNFVTVFGVDTRDMNREDLLACLHMALEQSENLRRDHAQNIRMRDFFDSCRSRARI